jgi:hypothetical protein
MNDLAQRLGFAVKGAEGVAVKAHRSRCLFGRNHNWIESFKKNETYRCWTCGCVSSNVKL